MSESALTARSVAPEAAQPVALGAEILQLDEASMVAREEQIPALAVAALNAAYHKALASGAKVLEVVADQLVETAPDGSRRVIQSLPPSWPVVPGTKRRLRPMLK